MKAMTATGKKWLAAGILIVLAIVITLLATFAGLDGKGPVRLVTRYVDSVNKQDFSSFCQCFMPDTQPTVRALAEKAGGEKAFFEKNYTNTFQSNPSNVNYGDNITILISDAKAQAQKIENGVYNGIKVADMKISAVSTVTCTMTTKGSLLETSDRVEVVCVKIDRHWYLYTMTTLPNETVSPTDV